VFEQRRTAQSTTGNFRFPGRRDERRIGVLLVAADAGQPRLAPAVRVVAVGSSFLLGRRPPPVPSGTDVWTVRDARVSSVHLTIEETDERAEDGVPTFVLRDLNSTNGTMVDGVPVTRSVKLRDGAVLFFGHHVAVFRTVTADALDCVQREQRAPFGPVPLLSPVMVPVLDKLRRLSEGTGEILLVGETGVGKEVYARAVHDASGRPGRFVAVNCAAIPQELVETELFGYVRGAHSQARESKTGLVEEAEGGTLFLDEIGEMSSHLQAKLLRFAQDRLLTPIGGTQPRRIDARILAATNRLEPLTSERGGGLRADLVSRLGAEPIELPPLRSHVEDVGVLAAHFLRGCSRRLEPVAFRSLCLHGWPGNVRELEKSLQEADVLSRDASSIELRHLPSRIIAQQRALGQPAPTAPGIRAAPSAPELEELLRRHQGNMTRVARELDRQPALVYRWVERFQLDPAAFRGKGH
jgi:transcriptional regulator with PAS, ATPase and Fis domain